MMETVGPKLEIIKGEGIKITIPEHLPKMSIFSKVVFIDNKPVYKNYSDARNRWQSLTREALANYNDKAIDPCMIYVIYYTPYVCDFDNYSIKFIIDALKYHGCIKDDNYHHLQEGIRRVRLDKINPRTEVYVVKDNGWMDKRLERYDKLIQQQQA